MKTDDGQWNKSLAAPKVDQEAAQEMLRPPLAKKNGLEGEASKPLFKLRKFGAAGRN